MTRERALARARDLLDKGTVYKLGRGGFDPSKPLWSAERTADCSGFVAWAIGLPRELPPGSGRWLQTTTYWQGGGDVGLGLFDPFSFDRAEPSDLLVFPDAGQSQGHMGMVSATDAAGPLRVIHCSSSNFKNTGDAIRETDWTLFRTHPKTRLVKVDYAALRALVGLAPAQPDAPTMPPGIMIRSFELANDDTLKQVARGLLVLEATGGRVGGIGTVQDALNKLAKQHPQYAVDLGPAAKLRGFFGPKTSAALRALQGDQGIDANGDVDAATLVALDRALVDASHSSPTPALIAGSTQPLALSWRRDGAKFFAAANDGPEFYVGRRVTYKGRVGLSNQSSNDGAIYRSEEHASHLGHWAFLIEPTALCEGRGFFNRLNTYDRAVFTFGFLQFAAHVPNGDFVRLLRRLLALPQAPTYFPDLTLSAGRIARAAAGGTQSLESDATTEPLRQYLNPTSTDVDDAEVLNAVKLSHWCDNDPEHRRVQVEIAGETFRADMRVHNGRYNLGGRSDVTCLLIADIHHQGRAKVGRVREALAAASTEEGAWAELLEIGREAYPDRIATLESEVGRLVDAGVLGRRHYVAGTNDFA